MDGIRAWVENGAQNAENFFIDDDREYPAVDGSATICVGGIFEFYVTLTAPHCVTMRKPPTSPSLKQFLQKTAGDHDSPGKALSVATQAYLEIADALDDENADEDDDDYTQVDDDNDLMAQAAREGQATAEAAKRRKQMEMDAEFEKIKAQYDVTSLPKPAVERILADYNQVRQRKVQSGWTAAPNGRDLSLWNIELFDFEKGTKLHKDMDKVRARTGKASIQMTMKFPREYPFKPPFIRVVRPRFEFHTGRVTVGGSICTQLLTDDGWKPIYDIESVMETVRQQITDPESKAAIDHGKTDDYTEAEALEAFHRVAEHHKRVGW